MSDSDPVKIWLCTPCYDGKAFMSYMHGVVLTSLRCKEMGVGLELCSPISESHINRARNRCVNMAMNDPDMTHIFFVDSDIGFTFQDFATVVARDKDICGGMYPRKSEVPSLVGRVIPGAPVENGLIEADELGTGFLCIKRGVFETMRERGIAKKYLTDYGEDAGERPEWAYFDSGVRGSSDRWVSEDYWWCREARKLGYKVWADLNVKLSHSGVKVWKGDPMLMVVEPVPEEEIASK